jgi:hypothetical protein
MPVTRPIIDFSLFDPAIPLDSTPSASSIQYFSKIEDLEKPNSFQLYAMYEPDYWVLDGNYKFMPSDLSDVHVGWITEEQSNGSGVFAVPPVLTVTFTEDHDVEGLTLRFSEITGDWATDIDVEFFDAADVSLQNDNYTPTGPDFYTSQAVSGFRKIVITFNSTNKDYRFLRVRAIGYGKILTFTNTDIKSCTVVEQVDPLCLTLPIGTLDLTLFSSESAFNIVDPSGDYFDLQNRQPLDVYEEVDGTIIYIGHFFLDDWENPTDNEIIFRCIDIIGILDTVSYLGAFFPAADNRHVDDVLEEILTPLGVPFVFSAGIGGQAIDNHQVRGYVPRGSVREALQLIICGALGAVVCARQSVIEIYPRLFPNVVLGQNEYAHHLTAADKGAKQSLTLKKLVTRVETTVWEWELAATATEVFNATVASGDTQILFTNPVDVTSLSIVGGTFVSSSETWAVVNRATSGNITIEAQEWIANKKVVGLDNASAPAYAPPNVVVVDDLSTLRITDANAMNIGLMFYYNGRYLQKMRLYAPSLEVAQWVLVDTIRGAQVRINVEKMTLDLSGGFVCDVEGAGALWVP